MLLGRQPFVGLACIFVFLNNLFMFSLGNNRIANFLPPFVPDNLGWMAQHLTEYPLNSTFGWTRELPLAGPFVLRKLPDFSNLLLANQPCSQLQQALDDLGIDGIIEIAHYSNWHRIGQIVAATAIAKDLDLLSTYRTLGILTIEGHNVLNANLAYGLFHGALWYLVGTRDAPWPFIQHVLCQSPIASRQFFTQCLHGVGHGFFIRHTQNYNMCSSLMPVQNMSAVAAAYDSCLSAPSRGVAHLCSNGMFHGVIEAYNSNGTKHFSYPCDTFYPDTLFCWSFLWMMPNQFNYQPWRVQAMYSAPRWFASMCLEMSMREHNRFGCIYGLSAVYFPLYDHAVIAHNFSQLSDGVPQASTCVQVPSFVLLTGYTPILCDLLFTKMRPSRFSLHTLVDWCEQFVHPEPPRNLSFLEQKRWLACVYGSSSWTTTVVFERFNLSPTIGSQLCAQLLNVPWQLNNSFRQQANRLCNKAIMIFEKLYTWVDEFLELDGGHEIEREILNIIYN